jgi:DNA-binding beta-propeller fold protein YncE
MIFRIFIILLFTFLVSCRKDKPDPKKDPVDTGNLENQYGIFIANEGNFQWGNASVSYYNISDSSLIEDIFHNQNNRPLGDVCQSMTLINEHFYIVVNNSGKIEVVKAKDFKSTATITGLTSPRYIEKVNDKKAYVTDFKSNKIAVIDLSTNLITKFIPCPGFTEQLLVKDGKAFITNTHRAYVYVVNTTNDLIEDSAKVNFGPNSIALDKEGKIWVLSSGNNSEKAALQKINPQTLVVESKFELENSAHKLTINFTGDTLYFISRGIHQFPIVANSIAASPLISGNGKTFYGLGIEPESGNIFVADAIDYVQKGKILVYSSKGILLYSFNAGIIPGHFYFVKK